MSQTHLFRYRQFLFRVRDGSWDEGIVEEVVPVHMLARYGNEQRAGDDLARVDGRLGDDRGVSLRAEIGQGFEHVSQRQHLLPLACCHLQAHGIGRNIEQDNGFLGYFRENGSGR